MFSYRTTIYLTLSALLGFIWVPFGCGGGGAANQGVFIDSPVQGLSYETDTQSGVTDADGHFSYATGETIRLFLGDTDLGQATVKDIINPFDLVPGATPITQSRDIRAFIHDVGKGPVSPMEQVINRAVFLQTLDDDGNVGNGIHIPDAVPGLLGGVSVDFQKKLDRFPTNVPFRQFLADGFTQGLWGGGKPIQSAPRAMENLYQALGLTLDVDRWTTSTEDDLTDLNPPSTTKRTFDSEGRLAREETDLDGNGTIDERTDYFFDSFDRVVRKEVDTTGDGTPDQITTYQYDSQGNFIREERDTNGTPDFIVTKTYDELGHKIREEEDTGGNGTLDHVTTSEYDAEGNLIREESDFAPIGSVDTILTHEYDSRGNKIRDESDNDANPATPNAIATYQYDANDNQIRMDIDSNGDGTSDTFETWQYDAQNNLLKMEGPGGSISFQYDELGNTTYMEARQNPGNVLTGTVTLQYDARGNRTRIDEDEGGDGSVDKISTYDTFEPGNWMSVFLDLGIGGPP